MKAEVDRLSAQVADLNASLEAEQAARTAAVREAKEKGDKLERLEGALVGGRGGCALWGRRKISAQPRVVKLWLPFLACCACSPVLSNHLFLFQAPYPHLPAAGELEALQECTIGLGAGDQKEMLTRMLSKIGALEAAVASAEAKRREIHNQLVELKGNVRGWEGRGGG